MGGGQMSPHDETLRELGQSLVGAVIAPADPEYDTARRGFNALIDRRPAVIVRCVGAGDVATAFAFAREHELDVAVRGGGHNPAGHCVVEGGLVIDLSQLRSVEVDADARIARTEGGATWLDFDAATPGVRPRHTRRGRRLHRRLRAGARRRYRPPDRAVRSDVRQPRRGGDRHSCRGRHSCRPRRERGAALGAPRRRRQLRCGDAAGIPLAPARSRRRRVAHVSRERRPRRTSPLP